MLIRIQPRAAIPAHRSHLRHARALAGHLERLRLFVRVVPAPEAVARVRRGRACGCGRAAAAESGRRCTRAARTARGFSGLIPLVGHQLSIPHGPRKLLPASTGLSAAIGADLGGTKMAVGVVDEGQDVLWRSTEATTGRTLDELMETLEPSCVRGSRPARRSRRSGSGCRARSIASAAWPSPR